VNDDAVALERFECRPGDGAVVREHIGLDPGSQLEPARLRREKYLDGIRRLRAVEQYSGCSQRLAASGLSYAGVN
jgi:hypothetical protein